MRPHVRRLLLALGLSLLLHLAATGGIDWTAPEAVEVVPPIEARLVGPALKPPEAVPRRVPKPRPVSRPLAPQPAPAPVVPAEALAPVPEPEAVSEAPPPPDPMAAVLAALPERFGLHFRLRMGDGFDVGRVSHVWHRTGERYSLVASAQAEGLAALFVSGRYNQTSNGTITPRGLRPEAFWMQRKDRQFQARFDWASGQVHFGSRYGSAPLVEGAQDILSIAYHLALFPRPASGGTLAVAHGKRVQEYVYRELGEVVLELPAGTVPALHLRLSRGETDEIEVWLRRDPPHLPLKIGVVDGRRGESGVLVAEELP